MDSEELEAVLIGGLEPVVIDVVDYDPAWPGQYEVLAARVRDALGATALRIEHIGSTSVPGLAAKPIIDMLIVVDDVENEDNFVPPMESAGLVLRVREPGHRMMRTPTKDAHLHFYEPSAQAIRDYLDLRDWLRRHPDDREAYETVKRALAGQHWEDMNYYADAKSGVITEILRRART